MLENPNTKSNSNFEISFGNLKEDFKENYYLATNERSVENKIVPCMFIAERSNNKYAIAIEDVLGTQTMKYINLDYFEEWHYICINGKEN